MGSATPNRCLEISTHSHRKDIQSIASGNVRQHLEMLIRSLIGGGDGHQSLNDQAIGRPDAGNQRIRIAGHDARLLRLGTCIHLYQQARTATGGLGGICKGTGQLLAVEGLDDIEQGRRITGLVCLEWPDQSKLYPGSGRIAVLPAHLRLLNPVLAKDPMTRSQGRINGLGRLRLGHGRQRHFGGFAPASPGRILDEAAHPGEPQAYGRRIKTGRRGDDDAQ